MSGEVTFHPHAWGEERAYELNKQKNPQVPSVYHEAVIARQAADYVRQQLNPYLPVEPFEREYGERMRKKVRLEPEADKFLAAPKPPSKAVFQNCKAHMVSPNTFACILCGMSGMDMVND